jgi:predicted DNA-binding transcriptional regulator AlpA
MPTTRGAGAIAGSSRLSSTPRKQDPVMIKPYEGAAILRVSRSYFYRKIRERKVPGVVNLDGVLRLNRDVFLKWLKSHD